MSLNANYQKLEPVSYTHLDVYKRQELLSDRTIVRKLGARPVPLPNGNMTLPRVAGGATASYTGENKDAKTCLLYTSGMGPA